MKYLLPEEDLEKVRELYEAGKEKESRKLYKELLKKMKIEYLGKEYVVDKTFKEKLVWQNASTKE